ncbi:unnamed protein product [Malus baccata var. baccata]
MPRQEFWPPTNHQLIAPPNTTRKMAFGHKNKDTNEYHKQAGKPRKVRAREQDEPQPPSTVTCGMCGKKGYNRITCGQMQRQASQVKVA